jgi:hypothetical protein
MALRILQQPNEMAKLTDLVAPIFEKSGRTLEERPQQRYYRMVNKLLHSGLFEVTLCEKGRHWVGPDKKYDLLVRMPKAGKRYRTYARSINCITIMIGIGRLLQTDAAKAILPAYVDIDVRCQRCAHQSMPGYISMFKHVCDGICFECYGTGFSGRKLTVEAH